MFIASVLMRLGRAPLGAQRFAPTGLDSSFPNVAINISSLRDEDTNLY